MNKELIEIIELIAIQQPYRNFLCGCINCSYVECTNCIIRGDTYKENYPYKIIEISKKF